jgi:hypothetical protein
VIGFLKKDYSDIPLVPNKDEIDSVFTIPLSSLFDPTLQTTTDVLFSSSQNNINTKDQIQDPDRPVPLRVADPSTPTVQPPKDAAAMQSKLRIKAFTAGPWPVWGLTAYILDCFLQEIVVKCGQEGWSRNV